MKVNIFKNETPETKIKFEEVYGYSPEVCFTLKNAPIEIIELIKNKRYYHVTLLSLGKKIIKDGLKNDVHAIGIADIEYFEEIYYKYSKKRNDEFVKYYIKRKYEETPNGCRGSYVSCGPDVSLYQVPESLKFFLSNLYFLINSGRLDEKDQLKTESIFNKYYENIKSDKVAILEIEAIDPAVLNSTVGAYGYLDLSDEENIELINDIVKDYSPNLEIEGDINPKYIKINEEKELSIEVLEEGVKNSSFVVF